MASQMVKGNVTVSQEFMSINDFLELLFLRINNRIMMGSRKAFISRDLNLAKATMARFRTDDAYDPFFDFLYLIARVVANPHTYWVNKLRTFATQDQPLQGFAEMIIDWVHNFKRNPDENKYLLWLKDEVHRLPGLGHVLTILNIPGWILKHSRPVSEAERLGRTFTRNFLLLPSRK